MLKIESLYAGTNIDFAPEPSAKRAERQLHGSMFTFLEFASPDSNYVSLNNILNGLGPRCFKQLKALLVLNQAGEGEEPFPIWFVTFRGTGQIYPKSGNVDLSNKMKYNYRSYIYDAMTGKILGSTIHPTVELDKLK